MNPIKEKKFVDKESGITSELITLSSDYNELLNWKMIIESNIAATQMKIDAAKGEQAATGVYMDPKKYAGLNGYRRALGFLSQKIQHRLRELNYNSKNECMYTNFYICAKKILPSKIFLEIKEFSLKEKGDNI